MRLLLPLLITFALVSAANSANSLQDLVTADDAVLCLSPIDLDEATQPDVAKSQDLLKGLGCLRVGAGIRVTMMGSQESNGPWRVRLYPTGMSGGVTVWGLPYSFTMPDGTKLLPVVQARRR